MEKKNREIWRDVIGYEGYYQVSDEGRVRSLDRNVLTKRGERFYKGKIIEGSYTNGYRQVTLSRNGKARNFKVFQLVAMTFLGHIPNGHTLVVDHIDGDRYDDNVDNLRIVTHRNNLSSCFRKDRNTLSSDFVGVSYFKPTNKWRAMIFFNETQIHLGLFDNELDASNMYKKVLTEINNNTFNPEKYKPKWTSKYKGVSFNKASRKYIAQPTINGKQIYLGYHSSEELAYQTILEYEATNLTLKNIDKKA